MTDRILVFVPAYNCGPQVGRVLAQLSALPPGTVHGALVLDNGSTDDTREQALRAARLVTACPVLVGRNKGNYGLAGSHKAAFAHAAAAGYTHVLVLHGDDQGDIRDALPVLARGDHRDEKRDAYPFEVLAE